MFMQISYIHIKITKIQLIYFWQSTGKKKNLSTVFECEHCRWMFCFMISI